jgi:hypothetical protein
MPAIKMRKGVLRSVRIVTIGSSRSNTRVLNIAGIAQQWQEEEEKYQRNLIGMNEKLLAIGIIPNHLSMYRTDRCLTEILAELQGDMSEAASPSLGDFLGICDDLEMDDIEWETVLEDLDDGDTFQYAIQDIIGKQYVFDSLIDHP